jgi:O-antigen ligase
MARESGAMSSYALYNHDIGRQRLLSWLFLLIIIVYAGLGRDMFFNRIADPNTPDPIGAVLVYFRLLVAGTAILMVVMHRGLSRALHAVPRLILPFVLLALVSFLWAEDKTGTLRNAIVLFAFALAVPMIIDELGLQRVARLTLSMIAVVVILSALTAVLVPSIGRHVAGDAVQSSHAGQWRGIFAHKNSLGPWAAYGSVLLFTHRKLLDWPFLAWLVALVSAFACLSLAGSMTSILAAAILTATAVLLHFKRYMTNALFGCMVVIAAIFVFVTYTTAQEIVLYVAERGTDFSGRIYVWPIAKDIIWKHPILGYGYQTLGGPDFVNASTKTFGYFLSPESSYFSMLLELGVVGFCCFFGALAVGLFAGVNALGRLRNGDGDAIKMMAMILVSTMGIGITEATPYVPTGFIGPVNLIALLATLYAQRCGRRASTTTAMRGHTTPMLA